MITHSYSVVHYGADYLSYALQSVYHSVDQLHVIYTPHPSHGHQTDVPPVESREQLHQAAFAYDPDNKVHWYDISNAYYEGQHRDKAVEVCQKAGADMVLVVDCDEIWHKDILDKALDYAWELNRARNWLINFTHFWRSFDWVCRDQGWPVRIIDLRHRDGTGFIPAEFGEIYHFGYAVRNEIMAYKWRIHGHKDELRPDWLETKWQAWPPPEDCHPTNERGFWNPVKFDKTELPVLMRAHPFWDKERID